jgi:signal transduction histidine kinase
MRLSWNWSIERKLPLVFTGLLAIVIAGFTFTAYREVRRSGVRAASERLQGVTGVLVEMFGNSAQQVIATAQQVTERPAILTYLRAPLTGRRSDALAALQPTVPQAQIVSIELWDANGTPLLSTRTDLPPLQPETRQSLIHLLPPAAPAGIGTIRNLGRGDTLAYPVVAPVSDAGHVLGYVVQMRRVTANPQAVGLFRRLIGSEAALYFGNVDGGLWTDLTTTVPPPPAGARGTVVVKGQDTLIVREYRRAGGAAFLAASGRIRATPWVMLTEFPSGPILARARAFGLRMGAVALILLAAGAAAAWGLSRRMLGLQAQVGEREQALRETNAELEAFAYSVSHDLRAPLRAIHGFGQILLEDHGEGLDPEARRLMGVMSDNTRRMGQLIDDLLAFSRLGRKEVDATRVDMTELVRGVTDEIRRAEGDRALEIAIAPLPPARGDRQLLRQAVTNLLQNAAKFTRRRGGAARIDVGYRTEGAERVYYVKDNGAGFDPRYKDKLFGVFQRLHPEAEFEGTGVGLAIVQRIIHRHGGRVWAESKVDDGATFYFTLPGESQA